MKKMFNEGNQIHNLISSSGSGSDFLTSYGSGYGSGSTSQKVTVPTVPVPVPVPQHCLCRTDLCKNPRKSASLPCPFKEVISSVQMLSFLLGYGSIIIINVSGTSIPVIVWIQTYIEVLVADFQKNMEIDFFLCVISHLGIRFRAKNVHE
jgi:hypothetical protein